MKRFLFRAALPTVLVLVTLADFVAEIIREYRRPLTFPNITHSEDR